jgi:hypothetical protein
MVEVDDEGDSSAGTEQAQKYFQKRKTLDRSPSTAGEGGSAAHFLALHIGTFLDDSAYRWGATTERNVGQFNAGVTYRLGEWLNSADFMIRAEYTSFSLNEGSAGKISFVPMIMFPDSNSRFPLYFGLGAGPGFYLKQLPSHSVMSLDYQLVVGARFLNVVDRMGFFVEFGLKNDFQLFSPGQFDGLFLGAGAAWVF